MDEQLFYEFLKEQKLTKSFKKFVADKQSSMENLKYKLSVMIGDADFWIDHHFVITKDDKAFLQKWANTFDDDDVVLETGDMNGTENYWTGKMLQNLFNDVEGFLEGEDYCMGTSYTVEPTKEKVGDIKDGFYYCISNYLDDTYEDISEDLLDLFKKTSFYKDILKKQLRRKEWK